MLNPKTLMKKLWSNSIVTVVVLALAASTFAQNLTKFESKPGSKVKIDGTSNIHDWTVEGGIIAGTMELDSAFVNDPTSAKPGKIVAKVETTIPIRSLKSGNSLMDKRMYDAMTQTKYPKIEYRLTELTLKETPKSATGPFSFDSKGELTVSGHTNTVTFPVTMTKVDKNIKTTGTVSMKMTSYGIEPPGLIVAIHTGDEVKLTLDWMAGPPEGK